MLPLKCYSTRDVMVLGLDSRIIYTDKFLDALLYRNFIWKQKLLHFQVSTSKLSIGTYKDIIMKLKRAQRQMNCSVNELLW